MRNLLATLTAFGLFAASGLAATVVVVSDTFTNDPGPLNNRLVEAPQTAGDDWSPGDGSQTVTVGGKLQMGNIGTFAKAAAPFDDGARPAGTVSYRLSFDWTILDSTWVDNGANFYAGLGSANDAGGTFADFSLAAGFRLDGDFTGTSVTMRAAATDGVDFNPTSFNDVDTTLTRPNDSTDWSATFAIIYTLNSGEAEFFVDGNSLGTATYSGDIGGIWLKADSLDNVPHPGFLFDNVQLTAEVVPEPATFPLAALAILSLAWRRRRGGWAGRAFSRAAMPKPSRAFLLFDEAQDAFPPRPNGNGSTRWNSTNCLRTGSKATI